MLHPIFSCAAKCSVYVYIARADTPLRTCGACHQLLPKMCDTELLNLKTLGCFSKAEPVILLYFSDSVTKKRRSKNKC